MLCDALRLHVLIHTYIVVEVYTTRIRICTSNKKTTRSHATISPNPNGAGRRSVDKCSREAYGDASRFVRIGAYIHTVQMYV